MDFSDSKYFLNRWLASLGFQARVLHEGLDSRNPLLERVRALYFFTNNTDEFFMKRIGMLKQKIEAGISQTSIDGRTPRRQWDEACSLFRTHLDRQYDCWRDELLPALDEAGIRIVSPDDLPDRERVRLRKEFETRILPTLTPLAFDPSHPFPFLSNLSLSIGMSVRPRNSDQRERVFTRVKIPPDQAPFWVARATADEWVGVPLPQVIVAHLDVLLPDCEIEDVSLFRVTRSAKVEFDENEGEDLLARVEDMLARRRQAPAVRLEVDSKMPDDMRRLLLEQLDLDRQELIEHRGLVDFLGLEMLADIDRADLKYRDHSPQHHPLLRHRDEVEDADVFGTIRRSDVLVHHPYHSFAATTLRFLEEAAEDPDVVEIKIAIYRTDNDSKVLDALIRAARNSKQVAVLVELQARFDEHQNVRWVQVLEDEGIHVAYGKQDFKTHTKLALVVREEDDGVRLYAHIGTGNYHSVTARTYTDLGLLTADPALCHDVVSVFNIFTGPHHSAPFDRLLVAPLHMRRVFLDHIEREIESARAGKQARIIAKFNALEDVELTRALYRAGRAGVETDLIIRDVCRLRPQWGGVTGSVRVHSVIGRFLEHSRIFHFANSTEEDADPAWYIGSADWMSRNLDDRIEAVAPVQSAELQRELRVVLETCLADNRRRWRMQSDGDYVQCRPGEAMPELDTHEVLIERARDFVFGEHGARAEDILRRQPGPRARVAGE